MSNKNFVQLFLGLGIGLVVLFSTNCALALNGTGQSKSNAQLSRPTDEKEETTLIGKWTSSEAKIEFFEDGSMTINGDKFSYAVVGKIIVVETDQGQLEFPFTLKGNTLTVMVESRKVVYTRSSKDVNSEVAQPQTNSPGSTEPELVGKWCYMSNVQANDGGRMSNICFTLNGDGTYEYYSETSSSNPNGGTSSQSSDSGRWSATATTLTARSISGETKNYTLEKRNHPKTGDPMLVVEGDAFVTAYQKSPW